MRPYVTLYIIQSVSEGGMYYFAMNRNALCSSSFDTLTVGTQIV
jgi:hypothetical protein